MTRTINFSVNEFYHLYNRGSDKRIVFADARDYDRFVALLYVANSSTPVHVSDHQGLALAELLSVEKGHSLVDIGAYCLMPNHFHILAHEKIENGISMFMQKVTTGYTMYFNKKHERSGALFGGTFKAEHVDRDEYLKYLFAYIHLNPIKLIDSKWKENGVADMAKAEKYLSDYQYSSYLDYCGGNRRQAGILSKQSFPEYFETTSAFRDFVSWWLGIKNTTDAVKV